jgi:serine/threonine-protein kinase
VERYRVLRRLAMGGMAEIFLGLRREDDGRERAVVLKRPRQDRGEAALAALRHEASITRGLKHPQLIECIELVELGSLPCLVQEYVPGDNLRALVDGLGARMLPLTPSQAAFVARQVALGLAFAHEHTDPEGAPRSLIHNDLTPANVMVSHAGQVKVADFGIAALSLGKPIRSEMVQGKAGYLSPEAILGKPVDPRSDQFALGVVLYELLGSGRLFPSDEEEALESVARFNVKHLMPPPQASVLLWDVLQRLLQPDPRDRYPHMIDVVDALRVSAGQTREADLRALFQLAFPGWKSPLEGVPLRQPSQPPGAISPVRQPSSPPGMISPVRQPSQPPGVLTPRRPSQALPPPPPPPDPEPILLTQPIVPLAGRLQAELDAGPRSAVPTASLGALLVQQGRLTPERLKELEGVARGRPMEWVLEEAGEVTEREWMRVMGEATGMAVLRPDDLPLFAPPLLLLQRVPRSWAERLTVLPLAHTGSMLVVAMAELETARMLSSLRTASGCAQIRGVLAPRGALLDAIARCYDAHGLKRQPLLGTLPGSR